MKLDANRQGTDHFFIVGNPFQQPLFDDGDAVLGLCITFIDFAFKLCDKVVLEGFLIDITDTLYVDFCVPAGQPTIIVTAPYGDEFNG